MKLAFQQAELALEQDEIPIGAIIVQNKKVIAKAFNQTEQLGDATAHAEMIAITSAMNFLGSKYLKDCTLYVTLEPCMMCGGAIDHAHIERVVYGAKDEKKRIYCLSTTSVKQENRYR
jgi:tRNA(adenine34) deaminase